ncbi:hypothetical protein LCGC14_2105640 [marine sediment metagenome]|uniref:Radical SAM core domain-containing protein n=1 Tax=marine sediment metagenome TaxID=412755 RepID=A0A0F9GLT3_9ZZZZ
MGNIFSFFPDTRVSVSDDGTRIAPNVDRPRHHEPGCVLTINLTTACNLQCKYCYQEHLDRRTLSLQDVQRALKQVSTAACLPLVGIQFFGGEPLLELGLFKEIVSLCECEYPELSFSVVTNGTLLDRDTATFFRMHGISVITSWDGYGRYRVDRSGSDSSMRVLTNILQAAPILGDNLWVRFTVTPDVKDLVAPIRDLSETHIGQFIIKDVSWGGSDMVRTDLRRSKELYRHLAIYYLGEHRRNRDLLLCARGVGFSTILDDLASRKPRQMGCQGGISKLTLTADGEYIPCPRYGGANSNTFGSLSVGLTTEYYQPFRARCCPSACEACFAKPVCGGPCHPDLDHKPPDCSACELVRYRTILAIWLRHQMWKEPC